jgi:hypothetical protein
MRRVRELREGKNKPKHFRDHGLMRITLEERIVKKRLFGGQLQKSWIVKRQTSCMRNFQIRETLRYGSLIMIFVNSVMTLPCKPANLEIARMTGLKRIISP